MIVIARVYGHYVKILSVLVRILQPKKQIRYKQQIKDTLHAYMKRYNATEIKNIFESIMILKKYC